MSALKHFRKKFSSNNQNFTTLEKATDNLSSSEKVCKTLYQILLKRKTSSPVKSQGKWLAEDLFSNVQVNWENTYQLPFLCTTETKLRVFQFKFLHRRVATNDFLLKIGKKETDSCSFCPLFASSLSRLNRQHIQSSPTPLPPHCLTLYI